MENEILEKFKEKNERFKKLSKKLDTYKLISNIFIEIYKKESNLKDNIDISKDYTLINGKYLFVHNNKNPENNGLYIIENNEYITKPFFEPQSFDDFYKIFNGPTAFSHLNENESSKLWELIKNVNLEVPKENPTYSNKKKETFSLEEVCI